MTRATAGELDDGTVWARFFVGTTEVHRWNEAGLDILDIIAKNLAERMTSRGFEVQPVYAVQDHDLLTTVVVIAKPVVRELAPGVYAKPDGELHVDVPTLLQAHGHEVTPANVERFAADMARNLGALGIAHETTE